MKIVYIADIGIEGGATKSLIELVSTMKNEHGVVPIVLTSGNGRLNQSLTERGIENYAVGHGAFLQGAPDAAWKKPIKWLLYAAYYYSHYHSSIQKALKVVDWNSVDLIHTNVARDDLGMEISKRTGVPNICHIREFAELDFNCWTYRPNYVKYLAENTDGFIAISEAVKQYWVKKGLSGDKVQVVYNGVDYQKIIPANHMNWKTNGRFKMVIVGGVIPNKGQQQAIEAICMLPEGVRQHITLDVIGGITETYKAKLQEPLKKLGIEKQVRFLGSCNDVYDRLKEYHVGLMCSKAEGFGRVTVEYMHAGLVVIASNGGANPEIIEDNVSGLLYNREDVSQLSEKIAYLFRNRDIAVKLAENGQKIAKQMFTKEINSKKVFDVYSSIVGT